MSLWGWGGGTTTLPVTTCVSVFPWHLWVTGHVSVPIPIPIPIPVPSSVSP